VEARKGARSVPATSFAAPAATEGDIVATASANNQLTTLTSLVKKAGLEPR